jgi:hypothetical protein
MSWIFGYYSKHATDTINLSECHPKSIAVISNSKYYLAIGGNSNTIVYDSNNQGSNFFVCGFTFTQDSSKILDKNDWQTILNNTPDDLKALNGHFCGAFIKNDSITLFTDQLGLREFHIYENNDGWYFSTRLDWLLKLDDFEIDFNEFGSRWLLINQLSNKSIIKKIHRINCGSKVVINNKQYEIVENNWIPQRNNNHNTDEFKLILKKNILLGLINNKNLSLSLSGGMDSRVLLSFLLESKNENWDCHTFNTNERMDSVIAEKISKELKFKHRILSIKNPDTDGIISELFEYIGATYLTDSGFNSRKLMHYKYLSPDELIIDGGFGEIWRREYLTHLYHFGKKDLENRNYSNISKYLVNHKADIFTEKCYEFMNNGIINQIDTLTNLLPSIKEIGLANWLDLFSLKTRLINFYAPEQARVDNYVTAYMPFAQINLLNDLFNVPVEERKNNRLFKHIINSNCKKLVEFNLAKGDMSYPYYFTPVMKRIYSLLHNKFIKHNEGSEVDLFLLSVKDFLMDSLLSNAAREYEPYNYKLIYDKVLSYYNGNCGNRQFVNWFLTFEIFRQIMQGGKHQRSNPPDGRTSVKR